MNRRFTYIIITALAFISCTATAQVRVRGNVYGGGNLANVKGSSNVTINVTAPSSGNNVDGDVYGGGALAHVNSDDGINLTSGKATSVTLTSGTVGDVYGGGLGDDTHEAKVFGPVTVNINGGTANNVYGCNNLNGAPQNAVTVNINNGAMVAQDVFGGGNLANATVSPVVNINGGLVTRDVYGGGALANTGATTVNVLNGTVGGDVYGGGLGDASHAPEVNGVVTVNVGAYDGTDYTGSATINGNVFGCNNAAGSPKNNVFVNIYQTAHDETNGYPSSVTTLQALDAYGSAETQYALKAVYGGGNMASYAPATVGSGDPYKATVHIYQCESNTVQTVYGGGNAADATDVSVVIEGGYFNQIFGGGNGKSTPTFDNPGADISGTATTQIHGGLFHQLFGGSNSKGDVHTVALTIDNASGCRELIKESFGGANEADITGDVTTNLACSNIQIGTFYGGSNLADIINGDVTLNVYGGNYNRVFGGSKGRSESDPLGEKEADIKGNVTLNLYGGTISDAAFGGSDVLGNIIGKITVNVLDNESATCGLNVNHIYGGGNLTPYNPTNDPTFISPVVNVIHGNVGGNVYGGALGASATVTASPQVNIGYTAAAMGDLTTPNTLLYQLTHDNANYTSTTDPDDFEASVNGNVYGGGDLAVVSGSTAVNIQKSNTDVSGDVYGGGALANINTNTLVTISDGTVRTVYGGGMGQTSPTAIEALVNGNAQVAIAGGTINGTTIYATGASAIKGGVFCGCNERGTVKGNAVVGITGVVGKADNHINVYGGGLGENTNVQGSVAVTIGANVYGDVYGGSAKGLVNYAYVNNASPTTPTTGDVTTGVILNSGAVDGDIYGGGHGLDGASANVGRAVTVTINGGSVKNVFGCNNLLGAPQSTVQVDIQDGTVSQNVYGGGNQAAYGTAGNDQPVVNIYGGTVNTVHGGGLGYTAKVTGNPQVIVNQASGKTLDVTTVYGGGDQAETEGNPNVQLTAGTITSAFGGGNMAVVTGTTNVTLQGATATDIFGGGNQAGVTSTTTVNINSGNVTHGVYGGCNASGTVGGAVNVYVNGGTVGTSTSDLAYGVFGGGYGSGTGTSGAVTVTIGNDDNLTPTIFGNVYGGSAKGNVSATGNLTKVWLKKGAITGDIYGGGYGDEGANALVNGNVQVVVNGGTVSSIDANNGGRVFGCNNVNGTPKGSVEVMVNNTAATVVDPGTGAKTYALQGVYGGGNLAHYNPTQTNNEFPKVTVNGCASSIKDVFGGGNSAAVPNTNVIINAGDIKRVFAGGNGESGTSAHVGYMNTDANPTGAGYGTGKANATIKAGTIVQVFGGSNKTGVIRDNGALNIAKEGTTCDMIIGEVYGGGNEANGAAGSISIGCTGTLTAAHSSTPGNIGTTLEGIGSVYGGANAANVSSGIHLTIEDGIIQNVFGGNNASGTISGTIQVDVQKKADPCGWYVGNVYGGGNLADHTGASTVNIINGQVSNNVFGGGNEAGVGSASIAVSGGGISKGLYGGCNTSGIVVGDATISITGGTIGASGVGNTANVYGGGLGENTKVRGNVTVTVNNGTGTIYGDVYGGSAKGLVNCNDEGTAQYSNSKTDVTLTNGTIVGNIYGGGHGLDGKDAHVWGPITVTVNDGTVNNVFGGNNLEGSPQTSTLVDIKGGTINQDVYGGGNLADVNVATQVTIEGGEPKGNVYGGGAFASTGATTVNILDGTIGTSGNNETGNIYGGGLGGEQNSVTYEPAVNGVVTVNIGAPATGNINQLTAHTGNATILGSVYGCNNTAGSPQDNVFVNIYGTAAATAPDYAIANVFGGGNQADYSATDKTAKVTVYGCANAVERVFGGGNAAAAPHVETVIQGGRFDYVFGGGNGEVQAANITAGVSLAIHGGTVNHYFAGSNKTGSITGTTTLVIDNEGPCNELTIDEFFCGGNYAPIDHDVTTTIECGSNLANVQINNLYGGCNMADITGNVTLTVNGGKYLNIFGGSKGLENGNNDTEAADISGTVTLNIYGGTVGYMEGNTEHEGNIFGGSNYNGSIGGKITVNVENQNSGDCALDVSHANVFGGGNIAVYSGEPEVNIKHCTVKNVYGSGNGIANSDQTKGSTGATTVNIGDNVAGHKVTVTGNVYGGGKAAKVSGSTTVVMQKENTKVGKLFGGGAEAGVTGSTSVTLDNGTVADGVFGGCDVTGTVSGNTTVLLNNGNVGTDEDPANWDICGGGWGRSTTVGGNVTVTLNNVTAYSTVYGGSAYGDVNTDSSNTTTVTINGGYVEGNVYGGAFGDRLENYDAKVNGAVAVNIHGGTVNGDVYGCNNDFGAPQSTVAVNVTAGTITNVFGGGKLADYDGTPIVTISGGEIISQVVGGGDAATVAGSNVTISGGNIATGNTSERGVYGGCNQTKDVLGNAIVTITGGTIGNSTNHSNVFGGGYGKETRVGNNVEVLINGENATIWGDVYGGSALGNVNGNSSDPNKHTYVTFTKGTVDGDLYGGGLGDVGQNAAAKVNGAVAVTINGGQVDGSVYGCNNVYGAPQNTVKVDVYSSSGAIDKVFGGGNVAGYGGTPVVTIHNCNNSIGYVYGGGNAADVKGTDVTVYGGNEIQHVFGGCYGANVTEDGTNVKIYGGTIDTIYGGNNESGTIAGDIKVKVNKQAEGSATACTMKIKEVYGGGNKAASNAGEITIECTGTDANEGIDYVYGGANRADVTGPIVLTITEGRIANVFGGNNNSGTITNGITVNIEKKASPCVWEIGNVYGGGNLAEYSGTPKVNIKNGTVTNVFGGGNGDPNDNTQVPGQVGGSDVTIGDANADYCAVVTGNVYGGGNAAKVSGNTKVTYNDTHASSQVGNLFGGGNAAGVTGKTEVSLANGKVITNVYGGCNTKGTVGTTSTVTLTGGTVQGSVFGGGFGSNTEVTGKATVDISGNFTSVVQDVYGGGDNGQVNGGTAVNIH